MNTLVSILPEHLTEWTVKSAVAEEIATLNIESLTAEQLNERIRPKQTIETDGWWVRGVNWRNGLPMGNAFGQGKPDKLHVLDPSGKTAKYMTASGMEPDAIFLAMPDTSFWAKVYADEDIPRIWTEGAKKAGAGLSLGLATIALTGVWNWGKGGKLAPEVERWALKGTKHVIAFDSDYRDKPSCRKAVLAFAKLLIAKGCIVSIATWSQEWKGMDDFIVGNGGDAFLEALANAQTVKQWEKQLTVRLSEQWTQSSLAEKLAEEYRPKLAWHTDNKCWYWYGRKLDGMWLNVSDEVVGQLVTSEAKNLMGAVFKHDFIAGTIKFLKYELAVEDWEEAKGLIPLFDGVLDLTTMQLLPHSPGYRFLWQLPYKWQDRAIGCQPVVGWLDEIMQGNSELVQLLRAYLKAVVTGRCDLHRFLECVGPGGTGKSTFQRLATALVGKENTLITTLRQLEGNRFETAALYGKRLALITDSERYGGEVSVLKAITGEDEIRNERKGVQQTRGFKFSGMVMVAANEPIQSSDYTSGLKRRRLTVPFSHKVLSHLRRNLESEFKPYLAGVLQWVLSLPDADMERLVRDTENSVPTLAVFSAEFLLETNPLADWLENCAVMIPKAKTYVGTLDKSPELYLYPSYCKWMQNTGSRAVSLRRFSESLVDLCSNQLKLPGVTKGRDNQGAYITGIDIRGYGMDNLPRLVTGGDGLVTDGDGSVTGQTRTSDGSDGCDGLNPLRIKKVDSEKIENLETNNQDNPSHPSLASISAVTHPSPVMDNPSPEPSPTIKSSSGKGFQPSLSPSSGVSLNRKFPENGESAMYAGEVVKVVGFVDNGRKYQIEFASGRTQYVKKGCLKPCP